MFWICPAFSSAFLSPSYFSFLGFSKFRSILTCMDLSRLGDVGVESLGGPRHSAGLVGSDLVLLDLLEFLVVYGGQRGSTRPFFIVGLTGLAHSTQLEILVVRRSAHKLKI
jgi:hypothetical protein